SWPKVDADHRGVLGGIDHKVLRMSSGKPCATKRLVRAERFSIEGMAWFITQIDDEFHRTVRQHSFQGMIRAQTFVKPEKGDELVKRRRWDPCQDRHETFRSFQCTRF